MPGNTTFCLVGISGTIALNVAGGWNFEGVWSTTGIPFRETVFAPYNLFIYVGWCHCSCLLIIPMHPSPERAKTVDRLYLMKYLQQKFINPPVK